MSRFLQISDRVQSLDCPQGSAVALGFFDGVHIGHQSVIRAAVDCARAEGLAAGVFTFRLPPMVSPRSKEGDEKAILASLAELEKTAEETGTYIYLEPLNRYQDHMLNTLADAVAIIDKGGFRRVKITADFYHMAIEEDDISESLKKYKDYVGHIHIAENHRYQPGTGSIDWARHMKTLHEIGYEGPVVNEGRIRGEDPKKVYQESVDFMKQFM